MNPFVFDWDEPVTPAERDRMLSELAERINGRGLALPAQWILEVHRPLMGILSQFAITLSPMLAPIFSGGAADMRKYTKLMADRENIDLLIALLDEKSPEAEVAAR